MTNRCRTFLAEDLVRVSDVSLDELELLEPILVPVEEADGQAGRGEWVNAMTMVALAAYHQHHAARS